MAGVWRLAMAGLAGTLLGVGLGRFAYTPLLPALIGEGWVDAAGGALLGAANLTGYLLGAVTAARTGRVLGPVPVLRAAMLVVAVSLLACAWNFGLVWLGVWRFLAGVGGAMLMILAAPTLMAQVPVEKKPLVAGIVFSGIGAGVMVSGTLLPWLAGHGASIAWAGLGVLSLAVTGWAWAQWPPTGRPLAAAAAGAKRSWPLWLFTLAYATDGMGFIPHTLFLSDYVARGLGQGLAMGGAYWFVFGLGAVAGPLLVSRLARLIGFAPALTLALAVKAVAVALPLLSSAPLPLGLSAFTVGALTPGCVALASGVAGQLAGATGHTAAWGRMTAIFALLQAGGGYALTALFTTTGSHRPLFAAGAAVLALGALAGLAGQVLLKKETTK
ncbi:YbfB/YjiJ family MFS transporter [Niveispirillum sp. KHB5.9]|uniref:YbfB/YjiJ family MFS transporter n=1 Tax=Niveispirillum sp. KHB5.9 TaxID=3400269 RepID=UPI003A866A66